METFHLVRDNYKDQPITKKVVGQELVGYLKNKLLTETTSLIVYPTMENFANVLEVINCLRDQLQIPSVQLEKFQEQKANKEGSYINGCLISITPTDPELPFKP